MNSGSIRRGNTNEFLEKLLSLFLTLYTAATSEDRRVSLGAAVFSFGPVQRGLGYVFINEL
jgi:hypothetical protein